MTQAPISNLRFRVKKDGPANHEINRAFCPCIAEDYEKQSFQRLLCKGREQLQLRVCLLGLQELWHNCALLRKRLCYRGCKCYLLRRACGLPECFRCSDARWVEPSPVTHRLLNCAGHLQRLLANLWFAASSLHGWRLALGCCLQFLPGGIGPPSPLLLLQLGDRPVPFRASPLQSRCGRLLRASYGLRLRCATGHHCCRCSSQWAHGGVCKSGGGGESWSCANFAANG
mmetsp:Transcript_940/g.2229  ORF Transcript_940/g.2229 Transcript_940/m.2229 type:complete len:229 (-) Transcript_940:1268-1954(-)